MALHSDMTGKVALVTGAGSGLGKATAQTLSGAGARLLLVDINADPLQQTAAEIGSQGGEVATLACDLGEADNCRLAIGRAVETFGQLDALCNVAAVFCPANTPDMSDADFDKTLAVNLAAPFRLIQAAIPHLLASHGAVVNVTSCAAFMGQAYLAAYSATKAGLTHMTKSLAMEYMYQPIRFNAVAPGGMATPMGHALAQLENPNPTLLGRIAPLRGLVEVEDVAEMIAYLASDASKGVHGACINFDSGITAG